MLKLPRAVLFDLDDTLLDRARTFERYFGKFALRYARQLGTCSSERISQAILDADGVGYRAREQMAEELLRNLPWQSRPSVREIVDNYRADFLDCAQLSDGIFELLDALAARSIKTGVITNGQSIVQRRKLERLGLSTRMDVIVVSGEFGLKKPDPAIFRHALDELRVQPKDAWFIGDHPDLDVAAAEAVGMIAFWLARMTPWPDGRSPCARRIDSLHDVLRLIVDPQHQ